jgi:hypothetical protein
VPNSQFRSPFDITPNGLRVKLTFELYPTEEIIEHASIRFLVMQRAPAGTAGSPFLMIPGNTHWATGDPNQWDLMIDTPQVHHLDPHKTARAIGIAITLKPDDPNPPAFDTLTWCVNIDLV